jgi:protein-tyrosine phosphatase
VEAPFAGIDAPFLEACRHVRGHGFGLLIAHPERAAGLLPDGLRRLRPVIADGALLQVNVCSLLGRQGPAAEHAAARVVRDGLAYVLASDGHGRGRRRHTLAVGTAAAVRAGASALRSRQLTGANPRFLLEHGIPAEPARARVAWHSPNEERVRAAMAAARRRRSAR